MKEARFGRKAAVKTFFIRNCAKQIESNQTFLPILVGFGFCLLLVRHRQALSDEACIAGINVDAAENWPSKLWFFIR